MIHALNEWMHEHWTYVYSDAIYATPIISLARSPTRPSRSSSTSTSAAPRSSSSASRRCPRGGPQVVRAAGVRPVLGARCRSSTSSSACTRGEPRLPALHERVGGPARGEWLPFDGARLAGVPRASLSRRQPRRRDGVDHRPRPATRFPKLKFMPVEYVGRLDPSVRSSKLQRATTSRRCSSTRTRSRCSSAERLRAHLPRARPGGLLDIGIPADRFMFGSDFPHPEGMGDPLAFSEVVTSLPSRTRSSSWAAPSPG